MKNILVSNYQNLGENVMVFTEKLTTFHLSSFLKIKQHTYDDIVEVSNSEVQYYTYEPLWTDEATEANVIEEVNKIFLSKN